MKPEIIAALTFDDIGVFIPIVAIVMGCGTGIISIYFHHRNRKEMFSLYHHERMAAIEKGIELPPLPEEFFREDRDNPRPHSPHRTLLAGLILLFVGLTLYPALHFTGTHTEGGGDAGLYALIPAGVGAAFLIYYFTVGRKLAADLEEEQKASMEEAALRRKGPE